VTSIALASAATAADAPTYEIWKGPPPGSEGWAQSEITFTIPAPPQNAPIDEWVALLGRWMASRGLM
jgi:hypothetical protein